MSHVTRHTSQITCHTSHVTRLTSYVTRSVQDTQASPQLEVETQCRRSDYHVHHGGAAASAATARHHAPPAQVFQQLQLLTSCADKVGASRHVFVSFLYSATVIRTKMCAPAHALRPTKKIYTFQKIRDDYVRRHLLRLSLSHTHNLPFACS
jgi:hypothetical protein